MLNVWISDVFLNCYERNKLIIAVVKNLRLSCKFGTSSKFAYKLYIRNLVYFDLCVWNVLSLSNPRNNLWAFFLCRMQAYKRRLLPPPLYHHRIRFGCLDSSVWSLWGRLGSVPAEGYRLFWYDVTYQLLCTIVLELPVLRDVQNVANSIPHAFCS